MNRAERQAADRAEYEASLERAKQATAEQKAHPASNAAGFGFMFGLGGLVVGSIMDSKRQAIPPRPDRN
jgi:Pyruvate/2-oxoacid:ferredoxin oxidoreductase gamma subunit